MYRHTYRNAQNLSSEHLFFHKSERNHLKDIKFRLQNRTFCLKNKDSILVQKEIESVYYEIKQS